MSKTDDRLAHLERRIAALENRQAEEGERPLPAPPRAPDDWRPWLERLHATVTDLAADQVDLHAQLGLVVDAIEARDTSSPEALPRIAWPEPPPPPGLGKRVAKLGVRALRRGRAVAKRVLQSSAPADWIHRLPQDSPPRRLTAAVFAPSPGNLKDRWIERITGSAESGYRLESSDGAAPDEAQDFGALAAASSADVCVLPEGGEFRAEWLAAALDLMAIEDLAFLHLRTPDGSALLARWRWLSAGRLDPRKLSQAPRGSVLGKSIGLLGVEPALPAAAAESLRRFRGRWLASRSPRRPIEHSRHLGLGGEPEPEPASLLLVLTRALGGGLDRLVTTVASQADGPVILVQMAEEGFAPAHPTVLCQPGRSGSAIYPLAELLDLDDRPLVLRLLLERHRPRRVVHLGPGLGLFDVAESSDALGELARFEHLAVADPRFPGRLAAPPASAVPLETAVAPQKIAAPLPEADAARARLGLPVDAVVAAHLGDLGFDERPEDVLAAVAVRPEAERPWLLFAGRGPLEATLDDLATFYGLRRVRRVNAGVAEALAACDFVVSAAPALPNPWQLLAAAAHGKPTITALSGPAADSRGAVAVRVPPADPAALGDAIAAQVMSAGDASSS
ncbi:MAG: hypothetical protein AAGM22_02125 [Acidobacteriota bacterium]